jgi:DNA-binding IclR family transcriptional regulator
MGERRRAAIATLRAYAISAVGLPCREQMGGNIENRPKRESGSAPLGSAGKYRAPALEKGLDVLELLVAEARPLTMTDICQRLRRSQGEMFRMVQVLQARGFLEQDGATDGYFLTDRLFSMAMRHPPTQSLVEVALPRMRALAMRIGQSCHLAMHARGEIVVVARVESDELIGFSVRVGHRLSILQSASGAVLFGFQPEELRDRWLAMLPAETANDEIEAFVARADEARRQGFLRAASSFTSGITDLSAPVMRGDRAAAALTVPFIKHGNLRCGPAEAARHLADAAGLISGHLIESDSRV